MGQMEFAKVLIERWITDPDVHDLLDGSCHVLHLPTYYGEVVHPSVMPCGVGMVIYGRRGPEMFFEPFPKGACRLPYELITLQPITLVPVDYSTILCDDIPILGGYQEVFDVAASLEVDLDPNFATNILEALA